MSGQDGNRGYLLQSIIALLESLNEDDWDEITIEADEISQKVDIAWRSLDGLKVTQVKSSINQISKSLAEKWASELETSTSADEYNLILIGPCSASVIKLKKLGKVNVPSPKSLDIEGLLNGASYLLGSLLEREKIPHIPFAQLNGIANGIVTKISAYASFGKPLKRSDLLKLILDWTGTLKDHKSCLWEHVDFNNQRSIENAISGKRLGPKDVLDCPELSICKEIIIELKRSNSYWITGEAGCGKSITAWQVAKSFDDNGFQVLRPDYSAKPEDLLRDLLFDKNVLLVIDDAQQYSDKFIERLIENSCASLKVLFTSTDIEVSVQTPAIIDPIKAIREIKDNLILRKKELLPILQKFDDRIGDSYMDVSLERRLEHASQEKNPWNFFWVLRGGWQSANREFEGIRQFPKANLLLIVIAVSQISSCDAGIDRSLLIKRCKKHYISDREFKNAIDRLNSLSLIVISDGICRTKHISYARQLIAQCFSHKYYQSWPELVNVVTDVLLVPDLPLKGCVWLLSAIDLTDATRHSSGDLWRVVVNPLKQRCKMAPNNSEWAIGCYYYLMRLFGISANELVSDKAYLIDWFTSGLGRPANYSSNIANELINIGNSEGGEISSDSVRVIFEEIDKEKLVHLANNMQISDFYSFGELVGRITYYNPSWLKYFVSHFDWERTKNIINTAKIDDFYRVERVVTSIFWMHHFTSTIPDYRFVTDIIPYITKVFNNDPVNTVSSFDSIFRRCLGYGPHFLRRGSAPRAEQVEVAKEIVSGFYPTKVAEKMSDFVSRDLENLARTFYVINEIDEYFIDRVIPHILEDNFNESIKDDWILQSSELQHFITFFTKDSLQETAQRWITKHKDIIKGPLKSAFIAVSPSTAIEFHDSGRGLALFDSDRRWPLTVYALCMLADLDKEKCAEILKAHSEKILDSLYRLTLDHPKYIVAFFKVVKSVSENIYSELVNSINIQDKRAQDTINSLNRSQPTERKNYIKLAKIAVRTEGSLSKLGSDMLIALSC